MGICWPVALKKGLQYLQMCGYMHKTYDVRRTTYTLYRWHSGDGLSKIGHFCLIRHCTFRRQAIVQGWQRKIRSTHANNILIARNNTCFYHHPAQGRMKKSRKTKSSLNLHSHSQERKEKHTNHNACIHLAAVVHCFRVPSSILSYLINLTQWDNTTRPKLSYILWAMRMMLITPCRLCVRPTLVHGTQRYQPAVVCIIQFFYELNPSHVQNVGLLLRSPISLLHVNGWTTICNQWYANRFLRGSIHRPRVSHADTINRHIQRRVNRMLTFWKNNFLLIRLRTRPQ